MNEPKEYNRLPKCHEIVLQRKEQHTGTKMQTDMYHKCLSEILGKNFSVLKTRQEHAKMCLIVTI